MRSLLPSPSTSDLCHVFTMCTSLGLMLLLGSVGGWLFDPPPVGMFGGGGVALISVPFIWLGFVNLFKSIEDIE